MIMVAAIGLFDHRRRDRGHFFPITDGIGSKAPPTDQSVMSPWSIGGLVPLLITGRHASHR